MDIKNLKLAEQKMKSISNADLSWYDSKTPEVNFEENYSNDTIDFKIGDTIAHVVFGAGVIVGIKENLLDIAFKAPYGVKTLVKNHKAIKRMKN
jgi:DNA helicase-2/ATP-dependent DNA helicase PcrA